MKMNLKDVNVMKKSYWAFSSLFADKYLKSQTARESSFFSSVKTNINYAIGIFKYVATV